MLHAPLTEKTFHEQRPCKFGQHLGSDTTAEIDTARRHDLQSQISRFRSIDRHEEIDRLLAEAAFSVDRGT